MSLMKDLLTQNATALPAVIFQELMFVIFSKLMNSLQDDLRFSTIFIFTTLSWKKSVKHWMKDDLKNSETNILLFSNLNLKINLKGIYQ